MTQHAKSELALRVAPWCVGIAHVAVALTHGGPVAVPDVPAYLSIAQRFWGAVPVDELPYHPGYGILISPLGFLDGEALHSAALCVNALLAGLIVWMVQRLARHLTSSQWLLWASTLIACSHPSVSHASRVAWPETLTIVLLLGIGLCITNSDSRQLRVAGLLAGLVPLIHPRSVTITASLLIVGFLSGRVRETAMGISVGLLITAAGLQLTDTWQAARLTAAQDIGSEPGPVATFAGQLLAFSASTACLGLLGILLGLRVVVRKYGGFPADTAIAFFALSAVAMLALGGWVLAGSDRSDTLLYGRYMDPWAVPITVTTLCLVTKRLIPKSLYILATAVLVTSLGLVYLETSHVTQPPRGVMTASLRALWVVANEDLVATIIIAAAVSLLSIIALLRHLRIAVAALVIMTSASAVFTHSHLRDVGQIAKGQMTLGDLIPNETVCLEHDISSVKPYAIWLYRLDLPQIDHRHIDVRSDSRACGDYVIAGGKSLLGCEEAELLGREQRANWGLWRYPLTGCD